MWNFLKSPHLRISFSLSMLTVSILLFSELLGLVPNTKNAQIESRKVIAESTASVLSTAISEQQFKIAKEGLRSVVSRNPNVLSGALRTIDDEILFEFGEHEKFWTSSNLSDQSTPERIHVELYTDKGPWGSLELSFKSLDGEFLFQNSFYIVVLFAALVGFVVNFLFLKQSLRELDPDAVIPDRVRNALNILSEGILIVDNDGYIVFSNLAFANKTAMPAEQLVGKNSGDFCWETEHFKSDKTELPWFRALNGEQISKCVRVKLKNSLKEKYAFSVSVSPIAGSGKEVRGALVTFDDMTEIEIKNDELSRTVSRLESSQQEVSKQNKKLQILASRDPLTDLLNRRSFFQGFESLFAEALEEGEELSCVMVDIDHFKLVNDRYGHPEGDKVIKFLSEVLTNSSRSNDLVGRLGGEEFCVVQPGVSSEAAECIADRMRQIIEEGKDTGFCSELKITASFGVASLSNGMNCHTEMIEQSDKALYFAKESGRNRVVKWDQGLENGLSQIEPQQTSVQKPPKTLGEQSEKNENDTDKNASLIAPEVVGIKEADRKAPTPKQQNQLQVVADNNQDSPTVTNKPNAFHRANGTLIIDRIDQAIKRVQRYGNQIAVVSIDMSTLQFVDNNLEQAESSKLSKIVVGRVKQALRMTDSALQHEQHELCFRVFMQSRSEVIVLLTDIEQREMVTVILKRILELNNEPLEIEGVELFLSSSIGVSLYPGNGEDPDSLIKNANSAMLLAKNSPGRNNFHFYDEDVNRLSKRHVRLEAELHHALERGELVLYYQPIVAAKTGCILRMEALIRWQHPQLGDVSPDEFIPLAEQTGLINQISLWVVRSVCQQINSWQEAGNEYVNVAINLSPVDFRSSELANKIIKIVDDSGLPHEVIELEITETVAIEDMESTVNTVGKLSEAGFKIALDDFGTGYSSLSFIKMFPLSVVKIDRSFITEFTENSMDAALVSAVIAMSHSLGLTVVAEGVETKEQLHFLQDLHCDSVQGYLIGRPISGIDAYKLLAQPPELIWRVKGYIRAGAGVTTGGNKGADTCMIGVLNNFPEK